MTDSWTAPQARPSTARFEHLETSPICSGYEHTPAILDLRMVDPVVDLRAVFPDVDDHVHSLLDAQDLTR